MNNNLLEQLMTSVRGRSPSGLGMQLLQNLVGNVGMVPGGMVRKATQAGAQVGRNVDENIFGKPIGVQEHEPVFGAKDAGVKAGDYSPFDINKIYSDAAVSEVKKQATEHAKESVATQGPEKTLESASQMAQALGAPQSTQEQSPQVSQDQVGLLGSLLQGLYNPGGVNPETGQFEQASALFGLLKERPGDALLRQELAGEKPMQKGKSTEIALTHQNKMKELMVSQGIDENTATSEIFKSDLSGLIDAYNSVNLKGTLGNLLGAPAGFLGMDREDRKTFESSADSLVYSVASYIAGQEGRALSDRDITLVKRWAQFSLADRTPDFIGKLKNLVQKANTRLQQSGGQLLPDVDEILGRKNRRSSSASPGGATYYSESTGKYYDDQGNEVQ